MVLCASSTVQAQFPRLSLFSSPLSRWKTPARRERAEAAATGCRTKGLWLGGSLQRGVPPPQRLALAAAVCRCFASGTTHLSGLSQECELGCEQGSSHCLNHVVGSRVRGWGLMAAWGPFGEGDVPWSAPLSCSRLASWAPALPLLGSTAQDRQRCWRDERQGQVHKTQTQADPPQCAAGAHSSGRAAAPLPRTHASPLQTSLHRREQGHHTPVLTKNQGCARELGVPDQRPLLSQWAPCPPPRLSCLVPSPLAEDRGCC